jgi:hypothetical protein
VSLPKPSSEIVEVVGLANLELPETGTYKVILSASSGAMEEVSLEVARAPR